MDQSEEVLIGKALVYLDHLYYLMDIEERLPIMDYRGMVKGEVLLDISLRVMDAQDKLVRAVGQCGGAQCCHRHHRCCLRRRCHCCCRCCHSRRRRRRHCRHCCHCRSAALVASRTHPRTHARQLDPEELEEEQLTAYVGRKLRVRFAIPAAKGLPNKLAEGAFARFKWFLDDAYTETPRATGRSINPEFAFVKETEQVATQQFCDFLAKD
ncbi:MAG: hypothetical protein ACK4ZJ_16100, partial [Allorhizobium sp.]